MLRLNRQVEQHWIAILSLAIGLTGCGQTPQGSQQPELRVATESEPPQVVVTSSVLCDLTRQIAQDTVMLNCLIEPGQDPHVYELTPTDRTAIEDADLVLYGGYDYEPDLIQAIAAVNTDSPKVAVFEEAVPNPLMGEGHEHEQEQEGTAEAEEHEHEEGTAAEEHEETAEGETEHEHEEGTAPDPHVWHDAQNGIRLVEVIREHLEEIAPENAELYSQNADALSAELEGLDTWIKAQVATVPESARKLVTSHEALGYYAQAYGFSVEGALSGLSTEEKPTAAQVAELVDLVKAAQVPAIFVEETANRQLIETVARDAEVAIAEQELFIEGPGAPGTAATTYQEMLVANTCTVVEALGGQCVAAEAPTPAQQ